MILRIEIKKDDVLTMVAKNAGYIARNDAMLPNADEDIYKRIGVMGEHQELLDDKFGQGCGLLTGELAAVGACLDEVDFGGYKAVVEMPYNWNSSTAETLTQQAKDFLANYITALWMRITKPDEEKKYSDDADMLLVGFGALLRRRRRLTRDEFAAHLREVTRVMGCCGDDCGCQEEDSNNDD